MLRVRLISLTLLLTLIGSLSRADLSSPAWWDQNAIGTAPDWHYRVPVQVPAGTPVNSTMKVNVDFAALLSQLGVSGTFDANSPRVVRGSGVLATQQEFTDTVYTDATDASGNGRGEMRFILEDAGATTYYVYFDIAENGTKPANPQTPINGSFELGASGTEDPPGWSATRSGATFDAQIRPSESVSVTSDGANATVNTDGTPFRGAQSYLLGARTNNEPASGANPRVTLTKTFVMPSTCSSGLALRYRPEGWDSAWGGSTQYDFIRIQLSGSTSRVIVGPNATGANGNYANFPYSPNFSSNNGAASNSNSGYGPYNAFDLNNNNGHEIGMTLARGSQPWFAPTDNLSGFTAGSTVTLTISSSHESLYRSWFHIDNVEWCVVNGSLGTPQGFGVNVSAPAGATTYTAGQRLTVRAQVDALPTSATTPVTAALYDNSGSLVTGGIRLFNDGTHGDATANDAIWSNDGSLAAEPTYTFSAGLSSGSSWRVVVAARDASSSSLGATAGLVHRPSQPNAPESQANFFNVDEQAFTVQVPWLINSKTTQVISDPFNGTSNPKSIPGARQAYTLRITNRGPVTVDSGSLAIVDAIPANTALYVLDIGATGAGPVIFTNGSPSSGLSWSFGGLVGSADSIEFSNNGGATWTYTPTPNANGCDPAVTHIRARPGGSMAASSGAGNPWFELRFQVRVN